MSRDSLSERAGTSRAHARANTLSMLQCQSRKAAHEGRALQAFALTGISQKPPNPAPKSALSGPDTRRACPGVGGSRWRARFWGAQKVRNSGFSKPCFWGASARFLSVFAKYANDVSDLVSSDSSHVAHRSAAEAARANERYLALRDVEPQHGFLVTRILERVLGGDTGPTRGLRGRDANDVAASLVGVLLSYHLPCFVDALSRRPLARTSAAHREGERCTTCA
jgi:hypothetical protein